MNQLFREIQHEKTLWSSGCSSFFTSHKSGFSKIPLAVKCRIGDLETTELALLDTGAEWSVIGGELSEILENQIGFPEESFSMSTRLGKIFGSLYRINISLSAEFGYDLTVESSVFLSHRNGMARLFSVIGVFWKEYDLPLIPVLLPVNSFFILVFLINPTGKDEIVPDFHKLFRRKFAEKSQKTDKN